MNPVPVPYFPIGSHKRGAVDERVQRPRVGEVVVDKFFRHCRRRKRDIVQIVAAVPHQVHLQFGLKGNGISGDLAVNLGG